MDTNMVDDPAKRESRKKAANMVDGYENNAFPNRRQRRSMAKKRGVFKNGGLFGRLTAGNKNVQTRRADEE